MNSATQEERMKVNSEEAALSEALIEWSIQLDWRQVTIGVREEREDEGVKIGARSQEGEGRG
jgi:hypothetical protein